LNPQPPRSNFLITTGSATLYPVELRPYFEFHTCGRFSLIMGSRRQTSSPFSPIPTDLSEPALDKSAFGLRSREPCAMRRGGMRRTWQSCRNCCGSSRALGQAPQMRVATVKLGRIIAGRSQLRLATFLLPTHREVVAAAFGFPLWLPHFKRAPRLPCVPAACLHSPPPRSNESITHDQRIALTRP
jgi:hypothetical protein